MLMDDNFQPDKMMPAWSDQGINNDLPVELHDFFDTFDASPEFKVTIQSFNNEQYTGRPSIIGEYNDEIPNYEKLIKTNGPKFYRYKFLYKHENVSKKKYIDVDLTSKNWVLLAKEGDRERARVRQDQIKEDMDERNALLAFGGQGPGNQQTAQEAMKDTINMMTPLLTLMKSGSSDDGGFGIKEMMLFMAQSQQTSNNQMMQMFGMMHKSQSDMMIPLLGNKTDNSDKLFNMAERMLNFKALVSPKEEGLIDKIGNFISNNIDTLGTLLSKPPEQREQDTGYQKVKKDWRMKKIKEKMEGNKEFARRLIDHIDNKVGAENTDKILNGFIKYHRPDEVQEPQTESTSPAGDEITEDDFEE